MRIYLISALFLYGGCAVRQPVAANWRLIGQGSGDLLVPPGVARPDLSRRTLAVDLTAGHGACPPAIRIKGKRVVVTVTRDMLLQQPPGGLATWAAGIEAQGCIAPGESSLLAARIAESLPLDPAIAFHLLYPNDRQTGEVDIAPPVRLQVVSPILLDEAAPDAPIEVSGEGNTLNVTVKSSDNLIGYETAWYSVQSGTVKPLYAERHIGNQVERRSQPATNYFQFASGSAFHRLFYKSGQTAFTALVIAAPTRAELDRRTRVLDAGAASCEKLNGELCVAIPRRVAINPLIPVTVNGAEAWVNWGANVAEAIRNSGERQPQTVLSKLSVLKLYNGRPAAVNFDRISPAILSLILTGGESITWNR